MTFAQSRHSRGRGQEEEGEKRDERWAAEDGLRCGAAVLLCGGINKQPRAQRSTYAALTLQLNLDGKWIVRAQGCVNSCIHVTGACDSRVTLCVFRMCDTFFNLLVDRYKDQELEEKKVYLIYVLSSDFVRQVSRTKTYSVIHFARWTHLFM